MLTLAASIHYAGAIITALVITAVYIFLKNDGDYYAISSKSKQLQPDGNSCNTGLRIYHSCDSKKWKDFCIEEAKEMFISDYYDKKKCTALIGLPFLNRLGHDNLEIIIEALVSKCNYNIVLLNNSKHTFVYPWKYLEAVDNSYEDAKLFAAALNEAMRSGLLRWDCIVGVGYSLAANSIGHVCRLLNHKCQAIYAIDPAGPSFQLPGPNVPPSRQLVSQKDACHVVYLLCTVGILGTKYHLGHVNILLNDGVNQPNCNFGLLVKFLPWIQQSCSHSHCNKVFAKALASPGSCVARKCELLGNTRTKACGDKTEYHLDLAPDVRFFRCGARKPELFFLDTSSDFTCNQTP